MQATSPDFKPELLGVSVNALCQQIKKDNENRVSAWSSKAQASIASVASLALFFLLEIVLFSEKRTLRAKTPHIIFAGDNRLSTALKITAYAILAFSVGKIIHTRAGILQKERDCALEAFRREVPSDSNNFRIAHYTLLKRGVKCLSHKSQKALIKGMSFPQLIAVADDIGRERLRNILSRSTGRWDALLMYKILELPQRGRETLQKLSSTVYESYIRANVFFYRGLQEHLKDHEQPEVHSLLRKLQWGDMALPPSKDTSSVLVRFRDGKEAIFSKKLLNRQCVTIRYCLPRQDSVLSLPDTTKENFEAFVHILEQRPEKLEVLEVKTLLPLACTLLAPKIYKAFDTYIACHLEKFNDLEIETLIKLYLPYLQDTKNQYEIELISRQEISVTQLVMLYKKGEKLNLTRLRRYAAARLGKHLLVILRHPQNAKLSRYLSLMKQTFNKHDYALVLAHLVHKINPKNVVELFRFNQLERCNALNEAILLFCKNNAARLAAKFHVYRIALPQEIQNILYPA